MRKYEIYIVAEDASGHKVEFTEIIKYPHLSEQLLSHCVDERVREADGIEQVQHRMPHLRNVRAKGSLGVSSQ